MASSSLASESTLDSSSSSLVSSLRRELDEARSELAVNACLRENADLLEQRNRLLREERDSLQHLLNEALGNNNSDESNNVAMKHELLKTRAMLAQASAENQQLRSILNNEDVKESTLNNLLSAADATKSLITRKATNLLTLASDNKNSLQGNKSSDNVANGNKGGSGVALDDDEHELMQSTIVSLEEQVSALKHKLRETDALLCEHEKRSSDLVLNVDSLSAFLDKHYADPHQASNALTSLCDDSVNRDEESKDLFTTLLTTRLALLHSELASTKKLLSSKSSLIDEMRSAMRLCRQEALVDNERLLREQRANLRFRNVVNSLLSLEQKESLSKKELDLETSTGLPIHQGEPSRSSDDSSEGSPSTSDGDVLSSSPSSSLSAPNMKLVSTSSWDLLQSDVAHLKNQVLKLIPKEDLESIEGLQKTIKDLELHNTKLIERESELRSELKTEADFRRETESRWNEESEVHRNETSRLNKQTQELEGLLEQLRMAFNVMHEALKKDADSLIRDREHLVKELRREQRENDILMGRHQEKANEMQNEMIDLPQNLDDLHLLLLKLREELITAKLARERLEEKSRSEIEMLKAQINHEHSLRMGVEQSRDEDVKMLREQLTHALRRQQELQTETQTNKSERELKEQTISELEKKNVERLKVEKENGDLKSRISILQQELDNSVAVQNDFVRLSQSLQIQLEKIRQAETEVRWQHEDDVDNCNTCRTSLPVNRRKHHCRHCGRIFCSECLDKSVPSGPTRRLAKVCGVCHTLLVQHSAPYFSSQAPNTQ